MKELNDLQQNIYQFKSFRCDKHDDKIIELCVDDSCGKEFKNQFLCEICELQDTHTKQKSHKTKKIKKLLVDIQNEVLQSLEQTENISQNYVQEILNMRKSITMMQYNLQKLLIQMNELIQKQENNFENQKNSHQQILMTIKSITSTQINYDEFQQLFQNLLNQFEINGDEILLKDLNQVYFKDYQVTIENKTSDLYNLYNQETREIQNHFTKNIQENENKDEQLVIKLNSTQIHNNKNNAIQKMEKKGRKQLKNEVQKLQVQEVWLHTSDSDEALQTNNIGLQKTQEKILQKQANKIQQQKKQAQDSDKDSDSNEQPVKAKQQLNKKFPQKQAQKSDTIEKKSYIQIVDSDSQGSQKEMISIGSHQFVGEAGNKNRKGKIMIDVYDEKKLIYYQDDFVLNKKIKVYQNLECFMNKDVLRKIELPKPITLCGTGSVIYKNCLYFIEKHDEQNIYQLNLTTQNLQKVQIKDCSCKYIVRWCGSNTIQFICDYSGLYLLYIEKKDEKLKICEIDNNLQIISYYIVKEIKKKQIGAIFKVNNFFYTLDHENQEPGKINYKIDFEKKTIEKINITFENAGGYDASLTYYPDFKSLMTESNGSIYKYLVNFENK